jgi:type I restriction enzyme S subunit
MLAPVKQIIPQFFSWLFKSQPYIQALQSTTNLVRDGKALRFSNFCQVDIPVIPADEQLAIATFLDHETAKIDALIAEQQRLIELLQEKRQAVISHAVTKGLNPDAPMKDSGVEWLGEVPEHWVVGKLSYYAVVSTGATPDRQRPDFWGGDIPWIKTGEVRSEDIQQAEECITELALKETSCDLLQPGTLLMALYGQGVTRGRVGLLAIPAACNQACAAIKPFPVLSARFLELYFVNAYTHIRSLGNETTQQNLNLDYVRGLEVLLPPQEEQDLIWRSCGERIKRIVSLLGCSFDAIALLQERRSALISAAVTGQIDVRGLVPEAEAA